MPLDFASDDANPRAIVFERVRELHVDGLRSSEIVERLMNEFVPPSVTRKIGGDHGLLYSVLIAGFRHLVTQANGDMRGELWRGGIAADEGAEQPGSICGERDDPPTWAERPARKDWKIDPKIGQRFVQASRFLSAYEFPLLGGGLLGDATIEDINASIAKCDARIIGGQKHKDMLLKVKENMRDSRDGARVRDVITPQKLAGMISNVPRDIP